MLLGLDAGGTKTHCAIAEDDGTIVSEGFGGAGNYQTCGIDEARESFREAVDKALRSAETQMSAVKAAVFGISGADEPRDLAILRPVVKEIVGNIPHEIVNDTLLGLRTGSETNTGIVSICGTGAGHAGRNDKGELLILRNLEYMTGNLGGGDDLVSSSLHFAFRSEEGTFHKSMLEEAVPALFGVSGMSEVCDLLRSCELTKEQRFKLPILVFDLAQKGDRVCRMLIEDMGREEGRYAAAVSRRLKMTETAFPAVLTGSLFKTGMPLLIDSYMASLHEASPRAYPVIPDKPPVVGAVLMAADINIGYCP